MSLVLRIGEPEGSPDNSIAALVYINAVTNYTKDYRGSVSKHPLDSGVSISDHFISENPIYNIQGVITAADISGTSSLLDIEGQQVFNQQFAPTPISVASGGLSKFIPDVVGQFFSLSGAEVIGPTDSVASDMNDWFEGIIDSLMTRISFNQKTNTYRNLVVPCALYEMEGTDIKRKVDSLIITSFIKEENPDTGNGLHFKMVLEQVRFVEVRKEALPQDVADSMKKKSATTENKGKADSKTKPVPTEGETKANEAPSKLKQAGTDIIKRFVM